MRYMLLIWENEALAAAQSEAEQQAVFADYMTFTDDLRARGVMQAGDPLMPSETAITVSVLAIIAVSAKGLAVRLAGRGSRRATRIGYGIEIGGALLVTLLGLMLFAASMTG